MSHSLQLEFAYQTRLGRSPVMPPSGSRLTLTGLPPSREGCLVISTNLGTSIFSTTQSIRPRNSNTAPKNKNRKKRKGAGAIISSGGEKK